MSTDRENIGAPPGAPPGAPLIAPLIARLSVRHGQRADAPEPQGAEDAVQPYFAPAKLNLFLHVTGRRPDGYHTLETAFQLIDLGDTVSIRVRPDGAIKRRIALPGVAEADDLSVRAAVLLKEATGTALGADLAVEKHVPQGGGLGGGSSDAATVMLALNHLWRLELPREQLMSLGMRLGADVPFFIFGRNAFARGAGEQLEPLALPPLWFVVLAPRVEVPTAAIFAAPELTRNAKSVKIADFSAGARLWAMEPDFRNDLQPVASAKFPQVGQALAVLRRACEAVAQPPVLSARMTGSGACVFAGFTQEQDARLVQDWLARQGENGRAAERVWAVPGLRQHPLHGYAG